jgi:hypothetical protein
VNALSRFWGSKLEIISEFFAEMNPALGQEKSRGADPQQ